jgi:two-component system KDP operon response regulator KdpE
VTSSAPCVAVIDDEAPIRRFLRASLGSEGFRIVEAATVKDGLRLIINERPELVLLDLGLPDGEGSEVIRQVREWSNVPFIVLSARGEEKSKLAAFDAGADDYLTKPFGVGELLARIRVALRHAARAETSVSEQSTLNIGPLQIDIAARRVFRDNEEIELTKIEFDLLATLARHAGHLRKKLERDPSQPQFLITEQGVGYRLQS